MRHRVNKKRLSRPTDQRKALVRSLVTALLVHGAVKTTESRAKILAAEVDSLIAGTNRQADEREKIRYAKRTLFVEAAQRALFERVLPVAQKRTSGFTRSTRLGPRKGDDAQMIYVELFTEQQ